MPEFARRAAVNMKMPLFTPEEVRTALKEAKNSRA